jgi:hypothetical protein
MLFHTFNVGRFQNRRCITRYRTLNKRCRSGNSLIYPNKNQEYSLFLRKDHPNDITDCSIRITDFKKRS